MSYHLFIDPELDPPSDGNIWELAASFTDVKYLIKSDGVPLFISFPRNLGAGEPTGPEIAEWLARRVIDGTDDLPEGFAWAAHTEDAATIAGIAAAFARCRTQRR